MGGDKIHETFLSEGLKERMLLEAQACVGWLQLCDSMSERY